MLRLTAYLCLAGALAAANPTLKPEDATVGRYLESHAVVTLGDGAPDDGLEITLRSSDPQKLLISTAADKAGSASVVIKARQGYLETPEFWLQALGDSGTVTYTAEARGYASGSGTVTLAPSAILIIGPLRAPKFVTTTGAGFTRVSLYAARLDAAGKNPVEQYVAGGYPVPVEVISSRAEVGRVVDSPLVLPPGRSSVILQFRPAGEGETVLSLKVPDRFSTPEQYASLGASVRKPGIALSDQLVIGENLELGGVLSIGEIAPHGGIKVTLTSEDPGALLLSKSESLVGTKSVDVTIPEGETSGRYYVQALGHSGTVSYSATAPGFRSRTAIVTLAPSGVVLTPASQGPPDEAQVLRIEAPDGVHRFYANLSKPQPMHLVAWTAQLDPVTHRCADITVQPLRGGLTLQVELKNANPEIGALVSAVTIPSGSDHAIAEFKPLHVGTAEISIVTPEKFTRSANATTVIGYVRQ